MPPLGGLVSRQFALGLAAVLWLTYSTLQLRHVYETAVRQPPTQRVVRDATQVRLPRLYFCPADRGRLSGFHWHSFECRLSYKDEKRTCPVVIERFRGRTPDEFRADMTNEGGECLEFGTHAIGVRAEWTAAWNEITLRAAFSVPTGGPPLENLLREVELGYLLSEWDTGNRDATIDRYYYPLIRVPHFFLQVGSLGPGIATRSFLEQEEDRGLSHAAHYWYTYGTVPLAVENATVPPETFMEAAPFPTGRVGIAHVVLTLEDFEKFEFQVVSCFFPVLNVLGDIAGVAAVLGLLFFHGPWAQKGTRGGLRGAVGVGDLESHAELDGAVGTVRQGSHYAQVASMDLDYDDDDNQEGRALLGGSRQAAGGSGGSAGDRGGARQDHWSAKDNSAAEALLATEPASEDGL